MNFPEVSLPEHGEHVSRLFHIHENRPGLLTRINQIFQYLQTTPEIGYVVIHVETAVEDTALQLMKALPGTIRARLLY